MSYWQVAQCGTTTFIVDPHEFANVSGTDGIDYNPDQTEDATGASVYDDAFPCSGDHGMITVYSYSRKDVKGISRTSEDSGTG